ncbi:MAG: hypothetical protein HXS44_11600 [Theionarchaea archaeon]|nr:hypothetical protein [Theionarchaea archaeon]
MRKMIVFLLMVGVLFLGTFAVIEGVSEDAHPHLNVDFSKGEYITGSGCEDMTPDCGGPGGGEGDAVG